MCLYGLCPGGVASADYVWQIALAYTDTYDAAGNQPAATNDFTTVPQGNGTMQYQITPGGAAVYHQFEVYLVAQGLTADQDFVSGQVGSHTTGTTQYPDGTLFVPYLPSALASLTTVNPPTMPAGGSNVPAVGSPWNINQFNTNSNAFAFDVMRGASQTGNGNGTYGDYAADMNGITSTAQLADTAALARFQRMWRDHGPQMATTLARWS